MKNVMVRALSLLVVFASLISLTDCRSRSSGDPDNVVQFRKLAGTWVLEKATRNGPIVEEYTNSVKLKISGVETAESFNYSVSGLPDPPGLWPWNPNGGTLAFGDPLQTKLVRDAGADEVEVDYTLTETTLVIKFQFSGDGWSGRISEIGGQWEFTFVKV